jgi:accessory gene regulator B
MKLKYASIIITSFLIMLCYFLPHKFLNTAVISIASAAAFMIVGKFK